MQPFNIRTTKNAVDTQPKEKEQERAEIQAQMDEWLSAGNKIEVVATEEPQKESRYGR